mmetsp:Transcript_33450/g.66954  ORF Transcript_33450/g.66954 Transcript_33450/m.66954 type:complete len:85 (-) Transcript_33450:12-266(-)
MAAFCCKVRRTFSSETDSGCVRCRFTKKEPHNLPLGMPSCKHHGCPALCIFCIGINVSIQNQTCDHIEKALRCSMPENFGIVHV